MYRSTTHKTPHNEIKDTATHCNTLQLPPSLSLSSIAREDPKFGVRCFDDIEYPRFPAVDFSEWQVGLREQILRGGGHEAGQKLVAEPFQSI